MKRIMRLSLVVGLLVVGLSLVSPTAEAGPFRRGWGGGYGWGRGAYGPGWGYRQVYRPYGYGWGGYRPGFRGFGPVYRPYPAYGLGMYGVGYPGMGYGGWGYPSVYGTSMTIGNPLGGFSMGMYPY